MTMTAHPRARGLLALAPLLALIACTSDEGAGGGDQPMIDATQTANLSGTWAGHLGDSNAFVAIVADGIELVAYVCDEGTIAEWFRAPIVDNLVTAAKPQSAFTAILDATEARGSVLLSDGSVHGFSASPTASDVLFRAEGGTIDSLLLGGWIVLPAGEQRGAFSLTPRVTTSPTASSAPTSPSIPSVTATAPKVLVAPKIDTSNLKPFLPPDLPPAELSPVLQPPKPMRPDTISKPTPNTNMTYVWAAAGDSYGSGEGDPLTPSDDASQVVWGTGEFTPDAVPDELRACHRSDNSGAVRAHLDLVEEFPNVDFQFMTVACSGAVVANLISAKKTEFSDRFVDPTSVVQRPQLDRVIDFRESEGQLDALYMSIGGNDAGFGKVIVDCLTKNLNDSCAASPSDEVMNHLLPELPERLDELSLFVINNHLNAAGTLVLHSLYPDPTRDQDLNNCGGESGATFGDVLALISPEEAEFARTQVLSQMNDPIRENAAQNGWGLVDGHLAQFERHGLCVTVTDDRPASQARWFNTGGDALARQGDDFPLDPDIRTLTAVALGLLSPVHLSAGIVHPNRFGYQAYAGAIEAKLRTDIENKLASYERLVTPGDIRIAAAEDGGAITLRWKDSSNLETRYEVEITPIEGEAAVSANPVILPGADIQEFRHEVAGRAVMSYRVRACNDTACSPYSGPIVGANFIPRVPIELSGEVANEQPTRQLRIASVKTRWTDRDPGAALEYVIKVRQIDPAGSTREFREPATSGPGFALLLQTFRDGATTISSQLAVYGFRVSSCSRVGCSRFTDELVVDARRLPNPTSPTPKPAAPDQQPDFLVGFDGRPTVTGPSTPVPPIPPLPSGPDVTTPQP